MTGHESLGLRPTIRRRLRFVCAFLSALVWGGSAALCAQVSQQVCQQATLPPNIILVFIDDMGWGDFSCFGNTEARTPHVDRLAAEGLRFEQFYVNAPICSPSRTAITTGNYPQRHRITSYLAHRRQNKSRGMAQWLDLAAPTLARTLQRAGYATGHFGKWHMGGQRDVVDAPPITAYGFDASLTNFEGMGKKLLPLTLRPGQPTPARIWQDAERLGEGFRWMLRSKITGGFVDAALQFLDQSVQAGKPFYINLWPDDVHSPFWPPVAKWAKPGRARYLAVLEEMDRQLGRLYDRVRKDPRLARRTLILVCSDNGPQKGAGSAGPFRGYKAQLYEGGIRSPLVVWGPDLVRGKGATNSDSVFSAIDLVPTLAAVAGVVPDPTLDGESLPGVLLGTSTGSRRAPIYFRRPPDRNSFYGDANLPDLALRAGRWKFLCEYDGSAPQLYDLDEDPGESRNLAAAQTERTASMIRQLRQWHRSMPADRGPALGRLKKRKQK